ncbi:hypothetical protein BVX93_00730, partial [bacterium B13(2017)]
IDQPVQTFNYALNNLAAPNTQILFKNGDTFNVSSINVNNISGPVIIDSYSDPSNPSSVKPIIFSTEVDGAWNILVLRSNINDWRIMNLTFSSGGYTSGDAGPRYPGGIGLSGTNNLIYKVKFSNLGTVMVGLNGEGNSIYGCFMEYFSRYGFYCTDGDPSNPLNQKQAIIGNIIRQAPEDDDTFFSDHREHLIRFQGGSKTFIAFNDFEALDTKTNIVIRGNSHEVVIYKNKLDRVNTFAPQNAGSEEYIHHCIAESNLYIGHDDPRFNNGYGVRQEAIGIKATNIVIRNNIFYNYQYALSLSDHPLVGDVENIFIYNNTIIGYQAGCAMMVTQDLPQGIENINNLFYNSTLESPG